MWLFGLLFVASLILNLIVQVHLHANSFMELHKTTLPRCVFNDIVERYPSVRFIRYRDWSVVADIHVVCGGRDSAGCSV